MLSQAAADFLARVAKEIVSSRILVLPPAGAQVEWEATSSAQAADFRLNMRRGRKNAAKMTFQERLETNEILLRLDIDGTPHSNPDGTVIPTPHLHVYRESVDDKWAFPVPPDLDISSGDPAAVLRQFLQYCGVDPIPPIQGGLLP